MRILVPLLSLALCASLAACTKGPNETSDGGNRTSEADPSLPTTQTGTAADAEAANGMETGMGATPANDPATAIPPATPSTLEPAAPLPEPAPAVVPPPTDQATGERTSMTPPPLPTE